MKVKNVGFEARPSLGYFNLLCDYLYCIEFQNEYDRHGCGLLTQLPEPCRY